MDLLTSKNVAIPRATLNAKSLINTTIALYGPSKSGKTTVIHNICRALKPKIPTWHLVSGSEQENPAFKGWIPKAAIRYDGSTEAMEAFLTTQYERQTAISCMYRKALELEPLMSLYGLIKNGDSEFKLKRILNAEHDLLSKVERINPKHLMGIPPPNAMSRYLQEQERIKEEMLNLKRVFFRNYIHSNRDILRRDSTLTQDEKYTLEYLDINPHNAIILEDIAHLIKNLQKTEVFKAFCYKGRHLCNTMLIAAQDDGDLVPNIRKNVHTSVFTVPEVAQTFFSRSSNGFNHSTSKLIYDINRTVFAPENPNYKLIYSRTENPQFKYIVPDIISEPIPLGCDGYREFCRVAEADSNEGVSKDNQFYSLFALD